MLIPAFAALARQFPDWVLVVAGPDEGNYRAHLEQQVKNLEVEPQVFFPGMVTGEPKASLLGHAELVALPSYSEGFPLIVAEALGYQRPLLITTTCYVPEVAARQAGLLTSFDEFLTRRLKQ